MGGEPRAAAFARRNEIGCRHGAFVRTGMRFFHGGAERRSRNLCVDAGRDASGQTGDGRPQMGGFGLLSGTGIIRISAEGLP